MKNLKNTFAAVALMAVMTVGTTFAGTGLLVSDATGLLVSDANGGTASQPCTGKTSYKNSKDFYSSFTGIIVHGVTGIIVHGVTGIIVHGAGTSQTDCGLLVSD